MKVLKFNQKILLGIDELPTSYPTNVIIMLVQYSHNKYKKLTIILYVINFMLNVFFMLNVLEKRENSSNSLIRHEYVEYLILKVEHVNMFGFCKAKVIQI